MLVSELVTNSLRHTGSAEIELEVWSSDEVVRVDVSDRGAGFDVDGPPRPGKASGWGLFMVDRLADRWGVETSGPRACGSSSCAARADAAGLYEAGLALA